MIDMPAFTPPLSVEDAIAVQNALRGRVATADDFDPPRTVAGVDCSYDPTRDLTRAVVVLMDAKTKEPEASAIAFAPTAFPYVPGLLSFREIPVILKALACLPTRPGMLMVDGQGVAHPRRLGIASHLGVLTGLPAIGVAKSRLTGRHAEPGPFRGDAAPLTDRGERIGTVLRSKERCLPLYISPGHRVSQETAVAVVMEWLRGYRLPEPTRIADLMSKWKEPKGSPFAERAARLL